MKRENINLLLAMIMVAGVMLLAFLCFRTGKALDNNLTGVSGSFQEATRDGEVEDVEGYALIVQGIGYGFGKLGYLIVMAAAVLLTIYATLLGIFAVAARVVFNRERLLAYRILMGVEYVLQAIAELILLWRMISDGFTPVCVATEILLLGMTIYSAVNTYSSRMQEQ